MFEDVILVFFAEVPDRGQDWVGRGLAEATERALANHAREFIEKGQVFFRSGAFGKRVKNAKSFVQAYSAGNTFSARF